mgnify:CR=1 FL=1
MRNCMKYENLPEEARAAARRIAKRRGLTPEKVADQSARVFSERNAVYRVRKIV